MEKTPKVLIEKELRNPFAVDGIAQPDGPYYALYALGEDGSKGSPITVVKGDIKEAAREGERLLDMSALAIAYKENPNSFKSNLDNCPKLENVVPTAVVLTTWEDVENVARMCDTVKAKYDLGFWGVFANREQFYSEVFERLKKGEKP